MQELVLNLKADWSVAATGSALNGNVNLPPASFPTNNEWKGTHGTVMEIHELHFKWDILQPPTATNTAGIFCQPHGFKQNNITNTNVTVIQGCVKHEGMLRTAASRTTNRWPIQERDGNAIAMCSKEFWYALRGVVTGDTGAPPTITVNEEGMVWNFRDGVGNGYRAGGNQLSLHWRVVFNDALSLKTDTTRILYPPTANDVTAGEVPDMYLRCFILFKWRDVDIHEWTRLHMENRDTI